MTSPELIDIEVSKKFDQEITITSKGDVQRVSVHKTFASNEKLDLRSQRASFAILLPITSRGSPWQVSCLQNLASFGKSLVRTTWRDTQSFGGRRYHVKVYLAIDHDDDFLLGSGDGEPAKEKLRNEGIVNVVTIVCNFPRGRICDIWRACARRAWQDGCHYLVLMGDDVVLQDEGWMRDSEAEFANMASRENVPHGFGCVAFTDVSFPGMPTFPIIHCTHMNIFEGEVVPKAFINQDGDPFLYQLYRRWGCAKMFSSRIHNKVGGQDEARYEKEHATDWTFEPLDKATEKVEKWLRKAAPAAKRKLTLDVVIPCYRVKLRFLERILNLHSSQTCAVMFIIIIDNPDSPHFFELESKYGYGADVLIRKNEKNMGASASRNRGMRESAAEWIHFLDDDVTPRPDLLVQIEKSIRAHPRAAGFVGYAQFPSADTVFTAAIHLAGVTCFWDIATKIEEDVPWGVTANLTVPRNNDGIEYGLQFPKTGGGEDIDFCRKKRQFSLDHGSEGFRAAPQVVVTHPWWNEGARSYWRFYMWAKGDGGLIKLYPENIYLDIAPNSSELLLISGASTAIGAIIWITTQRSFFCLFGVKSILGVLLANIMHDAYRHLFRDADRTRCMNTTVRGMRWVAAVVESSFIRMASEVGRTIGMLERGEGHLLGLRYEWFTGRAGSGPRDDERKNSRERLMVACAIVAVLSGM